MSERAPRRRLAYVGSIALMLVLASRALAQETPAPWHVILGKTQMIDGPKAFPAFCRKNAGGKRSEIRERTVARLREISRTEQPKIREELGLPAKGPSLWILNAVVARLDETQLERARASRWVKGVFPAGTVPGGAAPGQLPEILEPARREPFSAKGKKIPWNLEKLKVPQVWKKLGVTGEGVLVVSFDHGMDYRHEDLRGNVWINPKEVANNGKDDDGNGYVDDVHGFDFSRMSGVILPLQKNRPHGTWTSCLVVGDGTGGTVTGVAPRARILPVVANGGPYVAALAFEYAVEQGGDVVSMSFSIPGLGATRGLWRLLAEHATCAGLTLVSGSGNFRRSAKVPVQIRIPEGIPCVVCVGGVTPKLRLSNLSSCGPVEWKSVPLYGDHPLPRGLIKPDVVAFPGPRIGLVSTTLEGYLEENNPRQGNSLSAPQVAGTIALILSANPELTPWRVKEILERTARDLKPRGKDVETGSGLVDAFRAVRAAKDG